MAKTRKPAKKKILVVEDCDFIRRALVDKMTSGKFIILQATDGLIGLQMAIKERPHLILLDICMPRMDGIEMIERLDKDAWGKDVSIMVLTNNLDERIKERALCHHNCEYLIKAEWSLGALAEKIYQKLVIKKCHTHLRGGVKITTCEEV